MTQSAFASAQEALHALEEAYRCRDLEKAVACKDFRAEARIMLRQLNPLLAEDPEVLDEAAETLEAAFRQHLQSEGFPNFEGVETQIVKLEELPDEPGVFVATELQQLPSGEIHLEYILMAQDESGWRVIVPVYFQDSEEEEPEEPIGEFDLGPGG